MPIRGVLLIIILAVVVAFIYRDNIYTWLTSELSDDNNIDDDDNNNDNLEEDIKK